VLGARAIGNSMQQGWQKQGAAASQATFLSESPPSGAYQDARAPYFPTLLLSEGALCIELLVSPLLKRDRALVGPRHVVARSLPTLW